MLNKSGERELAYVVKVGWVRPIEGADNIELIGINGWTCIAKIGEFKEGDLAVYFEIDSKLPEADWSEFMASKGYKVKTMKLNKFKVISQGLALPFSAFGWEPEKYLEGDFLTKILGVTYSVAEDNDRKANNVDKYKKMAQRRPDIFKKPFVKWLYKYTWGKKLLFVFYGKKNDTRNWPVEVKKTDEERIENRPWTLEDSSKIWIATEKVDGSSSTFHLRRGKGFKKAEYFVCSRNVVFDTPEKEKNNYYKDTIGNIWVEMSEKYNMQEVLQRLLDERPTANWVTIQAETFGAGVQKRDYGMKDHDLRAFNLIYSDCGRVPTLKMKEILDKVGVPSVPVISEGMVLPKTIEELRTFVHSAPSAIDGKIKEGIVFRSEDGGDSFKCVDPEFLVKYHQ